MQWKIKRAKIKKKERKKEKEQNTRSDRKITKDPPLLAL